MKNLRVKWKLRWMAVFSLLLVLVISLGGMPSAAASEGLGPQEFHVTDRDNGRTVDLNGEVLVLNLESNPSTGYGWQVQGPGGGILRQLDAAEWQPHTQGKLGGWGTEVLRFAAVAKGRTTLSLVYVRPWETGAAPARSFSLKVNAGGPSKNVNNPELEEPTLAGAAPAAVPSLTALPSSYNWCDSATGCTPVRDQGNCGSCWAFGTVGSLEQAILIQDGASLDLAEQYLVSCNTDGWGCSGGWWAHDYHQWKFSFPEITAGAVYESQFPYTATDAPCGGPYTHHQPIADWVYIGSENGVPSTDAIKQAILDHGPVSAAVCVNTGFQSYTGGVFNPFWPCFSINHAIVLVGWDDSLGAWRLRNSWGSDWGEDGYMWIAYGKNYVGYGANYVVYTGSTPPTPPAAPSGLTAQAVSSSRIDLAWTDNASDETGYKIERCTGAGCSSFTQIATVGANVTSYSNTGLAPSTSYSYRVRATNTAGDSGYSNTASATTATVPPTAGFTFTTLGLTAAFTDASTDSDGTIVAWSWHFGDGTISAAQNPSHTYSAAGTYTVGLTVTDNAGATDAVSHDVTVSEAGNQAPTVSILSPADGAGFVLGSSIAFSGSATDAEDGDLTGSLTWTSNLDGPIGTGGSFSVALSEGTHTITAATTDSGGLTGDGVITVVVSPPVHQTVTVASLIPSSTTLNKNFWRATVVATINPALAGAVVQGTWGDGSAASCTTDGAGQCEMSTNVRTKTTSTTTFTVNDVALAGYEYIPGVTSVTVTKP